MFLGRLKRVLEFFIDADSSVILNNILASEEMQDFIIDLNQNDQLFTEGIDSEGVSLESIGGEYSPFTILEKESKGLPTDRITLFDTGDFYDTFRIELQKSFFLIIANTIKDGEDLQTRWGDAILGLTDKSKSILVNVLIDEYIKFIKTESLQ